MSKNASARMGKPDGENKKNKKYPTRAVRNTLKDEGQSGYSANSRVTVKFRVTQEG